MNRDKNVVLIGMPGVGKSTVGVLLAKRLGYAFLDTDIHIQTREGRSLREIIADLGTAGFCGLEEKHLLSITLKGHVIATGGSAVYSDQAMQHLGRDGFIVHLDLDCRQLQKRLDDIERRGVVIAPGQRIADLYTERDRLYRKYADVTVATDGMAPDQVVQKICDHPVIHHKG